MYVSTAFTPRGGNPAAVYPPVANGGEPSPQNNAEWRAALVEHFVFAHALFLSVASSNMYVGRKSPLATKNLLEVTDGLRRPP